MKKDSIIEIEQGNDMLKQINQLQSQLITDLQKKNSELESQIKHLEDLLKISLAAYSHALPASETGNVKWNGIFWEPNKK